MKIRSGELDKKIVLLEPQFVQGEFGKQLGVPFQHPPVWAKFMPDGGGETTNAGAIVAVNRAKFFIRYRNDVRQNWSVRDWLGNEYRIANFYELKRRDYLVLCCETHNGRA